jgi:uridine kinase
VSAVRPYVIAIGSYGGGGKTTLVRYLASSLNVSKISWDDYDEAGLMTHPDDWTAANTNDWKVPRLAADLAHLKQGLTVVSPLDGSSLQPTPYIIFDAPLGYAHRETGQHIDFFVFIDTPLDVAMARRILRDHFAGKETLTLEQTKSLKADLEGYLEFARHAFLGMDKNVKPLADLVVDGTLPIDVVAKQILEEVASHRTAD